MLTVRQGVVRAGAKRLCDVGMKSACGPAGVLRVRQPTRTAADKIRKEVFMLNAQLRSNVADEPPDLGLPCTQRMPNRAAPSAWFA